MIYHGHERALEMAHERMHEMHEMARRDALARQVRAPRRMRLRLGHALIAAGRMLVDSSIEPACDYPLAVAD